MKLFVSLYSLFFVFGGSFGDDDVSISLSRIQCGTKELIDRDPDRQYRLGHFWLEEECTPSLPIGDCMMGIRRMTPYFDGTWLQDDSQIWNRSDPFGTVFFPGGPGYGTGLPPWWNPSGVPFLNDDNGRQRTDFDTVIDILCTDFTYNTDQDSTSSSSSSSSSEDNSNNNNDGLYRTNCFSTGTIDVSNDPYIPFTFIESECDNGLPNGDCITFSELYNNCGNDCDRIILGPNDNTDFNNGPGALLTNLVIDGDGRCPPGFYGFKHDFLCGNFEDVGLKHTTCSLRENTNKKFVQYGEETIWDVDDDVRSTQAWYQWDKKDCTNGLPKGECIALLKATTYCCNYSFNFKSVQRKETVDGIRGPGIVFEVGDVDECESWLEDNYDGKFWLSVDYLCGIEVGQTVTN